MKKQQSITSIPLSPEAERRGRMIKYTLAMGIRIVCIVLMLFVHGWWLVACAIGAIVLPYFAVVAANVHADPRVTPVLRPGGVEVFRGDFSASESIPYQAPSSTKTRTGTEDDK